MLTLNVLPLFSSPSALLWCWLCAKPYLHFNVWFRPRMLPADMLSHMGFMRIQMFYQCKYKIGVCFPCGIVILATVGFALHLSWYSLGFCPELTYPPPNNPATFLRDPSQSKIGRHLNNQSNQAYFTLGIFPLIIWVPPFLKWHVPTGAGIYCVLLAIVHMVIHSTAKTLDTVL